MIKNRLAYYALLRKMYCSKSFDHQASDYTVLVWDVTSHSSKALGSGVMQ